MKLNEEDRSEHLEWCRAFLEHHCIFRSPPGSGGLLISGNGVLNTWQFYVQVATLNQEFAHRIGLLFWDLFGEKFKCEPFQICGCESGGVPLITALQYGARELGEEVNVFAVKKEQKEYGLKNWCEGIILENVPVMLVDDVVGQAGTLTTQANRLSQFGLTLCPEVFAIASCKAKRPIIIKVDDRTFEVTVLLCPDDFVMNLPAYVSKYGSQPAFYGMMR